MHEPGASTRVQLCGTFAVELSGVRMDQALPGRQGRLLFGYLTLFRPQPVPRELVDPGGHRSARPAGCGRLGGRCRLRAGRLNAHLAQTYPASPVRGFDTHAESIRLAREEAEDEQLTDRIEFTVAGAKDFSGGGDPVGAARHIRSSLAQDGVWLIVEPFAGGSVAENLTPVGRLYYSFSTYLCVPHALSEGAENPLGNQAGEAAIAGVVRAAGFADFQRVAQTPFNLVYAARP